MLACGSPDLRSARRSQPLPTRSDPPDQAGLDQGTIEPTEDDAGASGDDASVGVDASADAPSDSPFDGLRTTIFIVGPTDCGGFECNGGAAGVKDLSHLPTATQQCREHGLSRAVDFTVSTPLQGGGIVSVFCDYTGDFANTGYTCTKACPTCVAMATVTCVAQ
jgi:hypothetical protein